MTARQKGIFIVLEGPDGAGHGTQASMLEGRLAKHSGRGVIKTREPGGTPVGEAIRSIFTRKDFSPNPLTQLFLCAAFRAQHVEEKIIPSLNNGSHVISERFYYSTIAYQHYGEGVDRDLIEKTTRMAIGSFEPDLVIIIDVPAKVGLSRKHRDANRGGPQLDRFEVKELEYHERIRNAYLEIAKQYNFPVVDGTQEIDVISDQVLDLVKKKIEEKTIRLVS